MPHLVFVFAISFLFGCGAPHAPISEIARKRVAFIPVSSDPLLDSIKGRAQFRLAHHKLLGGENISVSESDGLVYLRGTVGSKKERAIADRVARDTLGVTAVKNELRISGSPQSSTLPSAVSDNDIEKMVMNTFSISKALRGAALTAEAKKGHVKIYGGDSRPEIALIAEELVKNLIGVVSVES